MYPELLEEKGMTSIVIDFKDGSQREFPHEGRLGGSYTKRVKYEGAFVIVEDEWYKTYAFPASDIREVRAYGVGQ